VTKLESLILIINIDNKVYYSVYTDLKDNKNLQEEIDKIYENLYFRVSLSDKIFR
jgi:hypothetical protein